MPKSTAWKALERQVAEHLNGVRLHRGGDFSESLPDVIAPLQGLVLTAKENIGLVVECKYRAEQSWINMYKKLCKQYPKYKCVILNKDGINPATGLQDTFSVISFFHLKDYFNTHNYAAKSIEIKKKIPAYLQEYHRQSRDYCTNIDTLDNIQLLYYKATKDRARPQFVSHRSMAVIGQRNDKVKLACFYQSEFSRSNA